MRAEQAMPDPRRGIEGEKGTREVRGKRAPLCGQGRACACGHMEALYDRSELVSQGRAFPVVGRHGANSSGSWK